MKLLLSCLMFLGLSAGAIPVSFEQEETEWLAYLTDEGLMLWNVLEDDITGPLPDSKYAELWARWSPNGRYLSYRGISSVIGQTEGMEITALVPNKLIAYDRETGASATIMDMTPFEDVANCQTECDCGSCTYFIQYFFWSADSHTLYYQIVGDGDEAGWFKTPVPEIEPTRWLDAPPSIDYTASPDQQWRLIQQENARYKLMNTNTGQITDGPEQIDLFTWRDATTLTYITASAAGTDVYSYDILTSTNRLLFSVEDQAIRWLEWRGDRLFFNPVSRTSSEIQPQLIWNAQDGAIEAARYENYSPDGQYALMSYAGGGLEVWSRERGIEQAIDDRTIWYTSWSPGADKLAYSTAQQTTVYFLSTGEKQVYQAVCEEPDCGLTMPNFSYVSWSPDGRWLVAHFTDTRWHYHQYYLIDTQTQHITQMPGANDYENHFFWQPQPFQNHGP